MQFVSLFTDLSESNSLHPLVLEVFYVNHGGNLDYEVGQ